MMGNAEYKIAFDRIILPVANQFKPGLILVASGFDAVAADPIGKNIFFSGSTATDCRPVYDCLNP